MATDSSWYSVNEMTGCWDYLLALNKGGYGVKTVARRTRLAHVVAYEGKHGEVPKGMVLDHLCRNRSCVNPDHLEAVTQKVNSQRGKVAKLNESLVREIRERYSNGEKQTWLAREYRVGQDEISRIVNRIRWSNI